MITKGKMLPIKVIVQAQIIDQPLSGVYHERIFDNQSPWNSQSWTWVKFTEKEGLDWVGHFRGSPKATAVSSLLDETIVLTSNYVFRLDNNNGDLKELEESPPYNDLTVAPSGHFIFADYYRIEVMNSSLTDKRIINAPIEMDMIKFNRWENNKLLFSCDEFANWSRHLLMELNTINWEIKIRSSNK